MDMKQFKSSITKHIVAKAMMETINKPRIRGLEINEAKALHDGGWVYKNATCEVIDTFINPITGKQTQEIYTAVYDGCLVMVSQGMKEI